MGLDRLELIPKHAERPAEGLGGGESVGSLGVEAGAVVAGAKVKPVVGIVGVFFDLGEVKGDSVLVHGGWIPVIADNGAEERFLVFGVDGHVLTVEGFPVNLVEGVVGVFFTDGKVRVVGYKNTALVVVAADDDGVADVVVWVEESFGEDIEVVGKKGFN